MFVVVADPSGESLAGVVVPASVSILLSAVTLRMRVSPSLKMISPVRGSISNDVGRMLVAVAGSPLPASVNNKFGLAWEVAGIKAPRMTIPKTTGFCFTVSFPNYQLMTLFLNYCAGL
jgi:hypothetical protein